MSKSFVNMYMFKVFWFEDGKEHYALFVYRDDALRFRDEHEGAILYHYRWEVRVEK